MKNLKGHGLIKAISQRKVSKRIVSIIIQKTSVTNRVFFINFNLQNSVKDSLEVINEKQMLRKASSIEHTRLSSMLAFLAKITQLFRLSTGVAVEFQEIRLNDLLFL